MTAEVSFAELYKTHYRLVFGICRRLLGAERAEDAAQEVFARAYRSFASYDGAQPFGAWISRIASNYCIDVIRRAKKERQIFGTESEERIAAEADSTNVLGDLLTVERAGEIRAAVAALPDRYRLPLVLAYFEEASHDDIAERLGITRQHVATLIFRAKQALRRELHADAEEQPA
jgi:RNA polymerase sigma-70 factor, ECF subfamily